MKSSKEPHFHTQIETGREEIVVKLGLPINYFDGQATNAGIQTF
jgi:hypothetical protein